MSQYSLLRGHRVLHPVSDTVCNTGVVIEPVLSAAVIDALGAGRAVVALESTIFSNLGLPSPANADALRRCCAAIEVGGRVLVLTVDPARRLASSLGGGTEDTPRSAAPPRISS